MKTFFTILSVFLIVLVLSCEKNETVEPPDNKEFVLSTDKNSYLNLQDIAFTLSNTSINNLAYLGCAFNNSPVFEIEKYTNEEWEIAHFALCVEYHWHPLLENKEISDTIYSNWLDFGRYRLTTRLLQDTTHFSVYSNEFEIK